MPPSVVEATTPADPPVDRPTADEEIVEPGAVEAAPPVPEPDEVAGAEPVEPPLSVIALAPVEPSLRALELALIEPVLRVPEPELVGPDAVFVEVEEALPVVDPEELVALGDPELLDELEPPGVGDDEAVLEGVGVSEVLDEAEAVGVSDELGVLALLLGVSDELGVLALLLGVSDELDELALLDAPATHWLSTQSSSPPLQVPQNTCPPQPFGSEPQLLPVGHVASGTHSGLLLEDELRTDDVESPVEMDELGLLPDGLEPSLEELVMEELPPLDELVDALHVLPSHVSPEAQLPQDRVPPQLSGMVPQLWPALHAVSGF